MKVFYHRIGQKQAEDSLMFEFPERPTAMVSSHVTHDGKYLMITVSEGSNGKVLLYYADLSIQENKNLT